LARAITLAPQGFLISTDAGASKRQPRADPPTRPAAALSLAVSR
jgi:hypothetical protein